MITKLKVCGMRAPANISSIAALEPDYMGFILYPPSKRYIGDLDPDSVKSLPPSIKATAVFVDETLELVKDKIEQYGFKAVQLHGSESPDYCRALKADAEVIKAFGIDDSFDFSILEQYEDAVDYFLFDTQTPEHGGSGKTFSWQLLQRYTLSKPYFLSGGIGIDHVAALQEINDGRLFAIDVNSKFESEPALKDVALVGKFKHALAGDSAAI